MNQFLKFYSREIFFELEYINTEARLFWLQVGLNIYINLFIFGCTGSSLLHIASLVALLVERGYSLVAAYGLLSLQLLLLLRSTASWLCSPMDCSPPGSSVHGILQARTHRSGLLCPPPGHLPNAGIKPESLASPTLAGGFFTISTTWEAPAIRQT